LPEESPDIRRLLFQLASGYGYTRGPMQHAAPLFVVILVLIACNSAPDDLREWNPADHRHTTEPQPGMQVPAGASSPLPMGLTEVSLMAWRTNCVSCHGSLGRGDGPQGAMVKARDLSDPTWQTSVTDEQIAQSIVKGRGQMPGFSLPPNVVQDLVRLIRLIGRSRATTSPATVPDAPSPSASTTP